MRAFLSWASDAWPEWPGSLLFLVYASVVAASLIGCLLAAFGVIHPR